MSLHPRFSYYAAIASGGSYDIPLPTAYGYSADHVIVLDGISAFYTASAAASAGQGGIMRTNVKVNGTALGNIVMTKVADVFFTTTAATSGVLCGGFSWESPIGRPLMYGATAVATNPGIPVTAARIDFTFTGTFATGSPAVELNVDWHYEAPAGRR